MHGNLKIGYCEMGLKQLTLIMLIQNAHKNRKFQGRPER
jgi:hypothetical protein